MFCDFKRYGPDVVCINCRFSWATDIDHTTIRRNCSVDMTTCVLRGPEFRKVKCKPCQADSFMPVMVPVYRCPKHGECTINATGAHPVIKGCAGCRDRQESYPTLQIGMPPPEVLEQIRQGGGLVSLGKIQVRPGLGPQ